VLLDDRHEQQQARDRTLLALELAGERVAELDAAEDIAHAIATTLAEELGLAFVWLWASRSPERRSERLAGIGERGGVLGRAIPLVAGGVRMGYLEVPASSDETEWLEASAPWIAAELYRARLLPAPVSAGESREARAKIWGLTPRQGAVLERLAAGQSNKEIASWLGCSVTTVEEHLTAIYRKAGVAGRHALLASLLTGSG
jgi:DNA-binding CsgD family transcriptional regulator